MLVTLIDTSGYLSGGASDTTPTKIRALTVIPGTSAGSWKIESGISGADTDLIPGNNKTVPTPAVTSEGMDTYHIPLRNPIPTGSQCYVTVSNCKLLIQHG